MWTAIKNIVKKHDKLYTWCLCIKNMRNPSFHKLVVGYFSEHLWTDADYVSIIVQNIGKDSKSKPVYYIDYGQEKECSMGLCALLRHSLVKLTVAEKLGLDAVIFWGKHTWYYDSAMDDDFDDNVFYYYFRPISGISHLRLDTPYIQAEKMPGCLNVLYNSGYYLNDNDILQLAIIYKKYIRLNDSAEQYIYGNIKRCLGDDRILGIHARGTDYHLGMGAHPVPITAEEYILKAKELFETGEYDKVFVATDDLHLLELFKTGFGGKMVCYEDVFRTVGNTGPHATSNDRRLHHYRLGLEVLRDVYTLANCKSLICGLSQVSFAARYVNLALDKKYSEIVIIDKGLNANRDSMRARYYLKTHKGP